MLSDRLKELRKEQQLSQRSLADKLDISQQSITAWETGRSEPTSGALTKIANFFGVSADYLLGQTDIKAPHSAADEKDLKEFLDQNLEAGMRYDDQELTEEDKERLKIALTQIFWKHHNNM